MYPLPLIAAALATAATICQAKTLLSIPTFDFNSTSPAASFSLSKLTHVLVDSRFQHTVDTEGKTLIPPSLLAFGRTFAQDLQELGLQGVPVQVSSSPQHNSIFLTICTDRFLDAAGRHTSEGPLGAFWGTRTVMQLVKLGNMTLPTGTGNDAPGWGTRGVMLDAGRHFYPPQFLTEICAYLSFFKQNTFHVHLSDNLFNNVDIYSRERSLDLYAAFRLNSDDKAVEGLVRPYRFNESYTREVFDWVQGECAARGVTIIPELEAPGHALVIAQWKPELALDDLSLLNISHPSTIPTIQTIWHTFLPWFHSKTVHIGADEYDASLANDYILFVNTLSSSILSTSNKNIRIWGTNEPSNTSAVSRNITIQHWEFFEDSPLSLIRQNYTLLNSDDAFYIVGKWSGSYPQQLNLTRIFAGNPASGGGAFAPNVFDTRNASNNPLRDDPRVIGHVAAQWNDYGPNATTVHEAYYAWRDALPALADKQWGGVLTREEYDDIFADLHSIIPGQNLDRKVKSKGNVILRYDFSTLSDGQIKDTSGNGYDATCVGCTLHSGGVLSFPSPTSRLTTPLSSKGRNYTLTLSINPSSLAPTGSPILSGADSTLVLGNGTLPALGLLSGDQAYMLNYTLPRDVWTDLTLIGRGNATFLKAGLGGPEMQFLAILGINGESFEWQPIAIEAPIKQIGGDGFLGSVRKFELLASA
ncbi:beta-hexosaminidase [Favolaschia claudopus]|uniref:beta-N-acetylhexosaminidase n=1 Tax=Favolaschia claudopus TaxID=2862362 RepID=A0AAW0B6S2_9AGAR